MILSSMDIVSHRKIFYAVSSVLFIASITAVSLWGLKFGIDFTGGSLIEVEFSGPRATVEELKRRLEALNLGEVRFQPTGERGLFIRLRHIDEPTHQAVLGALAPGRPGGQRDPGISEKRFDAIGPTIGRELAKRSIWAVILVISLIVSYIAWAFRKVSLPVASWKYGITAVAALVHDVVIPTGFFAVLGRFYGFEIDTLFITAILTILGFSVHDTIVVFDRIRENLKRPDTQGDFGALVNRSVKQTFARSVNTSLTVVLAMAAVYVFGGEITRAFSMTLLIGVIVGTYSSIFIASPLLVTWYSFVQRK